MFDSVLKPHIPQTAINTVVLSSKFSKWSDQRKFGTAKEISVVAFQHMCALILGTAAGSYEK